MTPTGVTADAAVGSPTVTGTALVTPTGVAADADVGTPTVTGTALVTTNRSLLDS